MSSSVKQPSYQTRNNRNNQNWNSDARLQSRHQSVGLVHQNRPAARTGHQVTVLIPPVKHPFAPKYSKQISYRLRNRVVENDAIEPASYHSCLGAPKLESIVSKYWVT